VAGSGECGDEPSGSGAMELVSTYFSHYMLFRYESQNTESTSQMHMHKACLL
jgi:hypothetical protein